MSIYQDGTEGAATDPVSLNATDHFSITVTGGGKRVIQPVLLTTSTLLVHVIYSRSAIHPGAAVAYTLATLKPSRCLANLGCEDFVGVDTYYIHGLLTDLAGTATNGGALDYIYQNQENTYMGTLKSILGLSVSEGISAIWLIITELR